MSGPRNKRTEKGQVVLPDASVLDDNDFSVVIDEDGDVLTELCPICGLAHDDEHPGCPNE